MKRRINQEHHIWQDLANKSSHIQNLESWKFRIQKTTTKNQKLKILEFENQTESDRKLPRKRPWRVPKISIFSYFTMDLFLFLICLNQILFFSRLFLLMGTGTGRLHDNLDSIIFICKVNWTCCCTKIISQLIILSDVLQFLKGWSKKSPE